MSIIYEYYEMLQYIIAVLIISFFSGLLIDNIFYINITGDIKDSLYSNSIHSEIIKKSKIESDVSTVILTLNILTHICIIVISIYYIKKIIYLFPNKTNYKVNVYLELAMIYISIQTNFYNKISLLKKRLFPNF